MIDEKMPIFVCKCCGNIIRAVAYEESDVYNCRICNSRMFRTEYNLNDGEYNSIISDVHKTFDFKSNIFNMYVQGNEQYSNEMHKKRLSEENRIFDRMMYGSSKKMV